MHLGHIELLVKDPAISKKFYVDVLGFTLIEEQGGGSFVWLKSGDSMVLLRPGNGAPKSTKYVSAASGMVIYTDNLDKAKTELESRGLIFKGNDGSDLCLTFTDPDGNWFQIVNPEDH